MNTGFIGTGLLGFPMAEKILKSGFALNIYNRTFEKALPLEKSGGTIKRDVKDLINDSDSIILMLSDFESIRKVLFEDKNILKGKTFIQMGTISPEESLELKKELNDNQAEYLEAPVLGSINEAKSGTLFIMVGSTPEQFEKYLNLFKTLGENPVLAGEVGKAAILKLSMNHLIAVLITGFSLSYEMIKSNGIDTDIFMDILRKSALYAPTYDKKLPKMISDDFSNPNFPVKHMLKDVNLVIETARQNNIETCTVEGLGKAFEKAVNNGLSDLDYSAVYKIFKNT